jgi:hypothetical protein
MKIFRVVPIWAKVAFCAGALALMCQAQAAQAETMRLEALLVWGTDEPQSPNPKHEPVDADLARRLRKLPYKWKNYFLVHREVAEVADGETKAKISMSKRCVLDIKNLGTNRVEVRLHGDGKPVSVHTETLPIRQLLILSGDAGNETGWLVIIRLVQRLDSPPPPLVKGTN